MVGPTLAQNGHWKSEKRTKVTAAAVASPPPAGAGPSTITGARDPVSTIFA
jgi:hypothetical protein